MLSDTISPSEHPAAGKLPVTVWPLGEILSAWRDLFDSLVNLTAIYAVQDMKVQLQEIALDS